MKQTGIKTLIYANLGLMCLVSCSTTFQPRPKTQSLKSAAVAPANPSWMARIVRNAENFHSADLFPKGSLDYVPPRQVVKKQVISANYDIRKDSGVTAAELNTGLKGVLKGKGSVIIKIARKHGIDPLFIFGLVSQESGAGVSKYAYSYNNVAGQLKKTKSGKYVPIQFKNVEECLERVCSRMQTVYIKEGRVVLSKVASKYCPVGAKNDPRGLNSHWLPGIIRNMKKIQSV